eukprot:TRINITY_DN15700_c0_g1_i1.p2 TRINITY_DN15700_c0_g1~~TRINITY_DN15700_c0_g1_i1.p2  ORF type:complete len:211 (+),score=74.91 TRINITY_DN15700_c0_g1_i1:600-1232(+)
MGTASGWLINNLAIMHRFRHSGLHPLSPLMKELLDSTRDRHYVSFWKIAQAAVGNISYPFMKEANTVKTRGDAERLVQKYYNFALAGARSTAATPSLELQETSTRVLTEKCKEYPLIDLRHENNNIAPDEHIQATATGEEEGEHYEDSDEEDGDDDREDTRREEEQEEEHGDDDVDKDSDETDGEEQEEEEEEEHDEMDRGEGGEEVPIN